MKRLSLLVAISLVVCIAAAPVNPPPTQAWRKIFIGATHHTAAAAMATDVSGNGYLTYTDFGTASNNIHLLKISPAMGVYFDKVVNFVTSGSAMALSLSPVISGKQYVYLFIWDNVSNNQSIYVYKWDTAGNAQWGGSAFVYGYPGLFNMFVHGIYCDTAGNLSLAITTPTPGSAGVYFWNLDASGNVTSSHLNTTIYPQSAFYSTTLNGWILAGNNESAADPTASHRWGFFDPVTGLESALGETADGTYNSTTGAMDLERFLVNGLPNDSFSVTHNSLIAASSASPVTRNTSMKVYASNGTISWMFPATGTRTGTVSQVASFPGSGLVYDCGLEASGGPEFVDQFSTTGANIWHHRYQPADNIFPWQDGFFTTLFNASNNYEYLEHAGISGTYDMGKIYSGTGGEVNRFGAWAGFKNSLFVAFNVANGTTGSDVVLDRFTTGVALQSITAASSVQSGHQLTVTINLNQGAPTGGYPVGISTSNNKLLLPNNTQGQFITVPAGMSSTTVILNAQTVAGSTPTRVLGIADGVRRFVDTAITP